MSEYQYPKASIQHRLGGKAVDAAMYTVTFGFGWLIWSLVVWGQGQTPGKQIVKMRVYNKTTLQPVKWGQMALREFVLPFSLYVITLIFLTFFRAANPDANPSYVFLIYLPLFVVWLVDACYIFAGDNKNRLVDIIAKTDVLNVAPQNPNRG